MYRFQAYITLKYIKGVWIQQVLRTESHQPQYIHSKQFDDMSYPGCFYLVLLQCMWDGMCDKSLPS